MSSHTPANAPPVGYATWLVVPHVCDPVATPSQYCVMTPLHVSAPVPSPLKNAWRSGAMFTGSPENWRFPDEFVLWDPHWLPQKTR